jgi:hypothetical protein
MWINNKWIIMQPHIYPNRKKIAGARGQGGDRSEGIPASKKATKMCFVNAVGNRRWGLSRLTTVAPRVSPPTPARGERGRRRERSAVERGTMKPMRAGTRRDDAGRHERGWFAARNPDERSASRRRSLRFKADEKSHCASLRWRALKRRRRESGESGNGSGELNERVTGRSL